MSNWYNREYDRWRGWNDRAEETLKQKKLREEYRYQIPTPVRNVNLPPLEQEASVDEVEEQLEILHQEIDKFDESFEEAKRQLEDIMDLLNKLKRGGRDEG